MSKDYFIEDCWSSSEDEESECWTQDRSALKDSPPALLAFSITSDRHGDTSPEPGPSCSLDEAAEETDSSDWSVEEWMILEEETTHEEDSTIQLHLSFSNSSSDSDAATEDEDKSLFQDWAVIKRDKEAGRVPSTFRYFLPGHVFCHVCTKFGHLAKSCPMQKKGPVCVLCGIQGHLKKDCPRRPCSRCGLLAHGARACFRPPVWHQHCQRCGMMGHLSDTCPDTWRQFHLTINTSEVPVQKHTCRSIKQRKRPVFCYNCSKKGHYGYECGYKRMNSGTFVTLPYVCHYDCNEAHHFSSRTKKRSIDFANKPQPLTEQQLCCKSFEEDGDNLLQNRTKIKHKVQLDVRKTWPERRRERQEVKRLRREAQARREGGILGQYQHRPDDDSLYFETGVSNSYRHTNSLKIIKKVSRNQKGSDTEERKIRIKKKRGLVRSHRSMGTESLHFSKRVRHRKR